MPAPCENIVPISRAKRQLLVGIATGAPAICVGMEHLTGVLHHLRYHRDAQTADFPYLELKDGKGG